MLKELPKNKIALFIPDYLNEIELNSVKNTVNKLIDSTHFNFSFYRTITEDFLIFLLELDFDQLNNFTLHFISSLYYSDERLIETVNYLVENGLTIKEHNLPVGSDNLASPQTYESFVKRIIKESDETLILFKRDEHQTSKMMKPLDVSVSMNKEGFMQRLDKNDLLIKI